MRLDELKIEYHDSMPTDLDGGILYISKKYQIAIHLCACGCGFQTVTPINKDNGWTLTESSEGITLRPSIGNFKGEKPYHAHYHITNNKIDWLN